MKTCPRPNCGKKHNKPGTYCSRSCANSRQFSDESRKLKSAKNRAHWDSLSDGEQGERKARLRAVQADGNRVVQEQWLAVPFEELTDVTARRKRILHEQGGVCNCCGINTWQDQPIPFELDHIDGNRFNNARENLHMLCPNCHAITPTWRGKKEGMRGKVTDEQLAEAYRETGKPSSALQACGMAASGTNMKRMRRIIRNVTTSGDYVDEQP